MRQDFLIGVDRYAQEIYSLRWMYAWRDVASNEPILEQVYLFIDRLNRRRVGIVENQLTGLAGQNLERAKLLISMADWFASTGKPNFLIGGKIGLLGQSAVPC